MSIALMLLLIYSGMHVAVALIMLSFCGVWFLRGSFDMGTAAAQTLVFGLVVGAVATVVTTLRARALKADA